MPIAAYIVDAQRTGKTILVRALKGCFVIEKPFLSSKNTTPPLILTIVVRTVSRQNNFTVEDIVSPPSKAQKERAADK